MDGADRPAEAADAASYEDVVREVARLLCEWEGSDELYREFAERLVRYIQLNISEWHEAPLAGESTPAQLRELRAFLDSKRTR